MRHADPLKFSPCDKAPYRKIIKKTTHLFELECGHYAAIPRKLGVIIKKEFNPSVVNFTEDQELPEIIDMSFQDMRQMNIGDSIPCYTDKCCDRQQIPSDRYFVADPIDHPNPEEDPKLLLPHRKRRWV